MLALWTLLRPFAPFLIGLVVIGGAFAAYKARLAYARHEGRVEIQAQWDADKQRRQQMVTNTVLLWDEQRKRTDEALRQLDKERTARFAPIRRRADSLPAGCIISPAAAGVLDDAIRASAATAAAGGAERPAPEPATTPPAEATDEKSLIGWGVTCSEMYGTAQVKYLQLQQFYESLRAKKGEAR